MYWTLLKCRRKRIGLFSAVLILTTLGVYYELESSSEQKLTESYEDVNKVHRVSVDENNPLSINTHKIIPQNYDVQRQSPYEYTADDYDYCNEISDMHFEEGAELRGFELVAVQIVIRHGDRAPVFSLPGIHQPEISCNMTSHEEISVLYNQFANKQIGRYLKIFDNKPNCKESQLTPKGLSQHIHIGKSLRNIYINRHKLFHEEVYGRKHRDIYIRSTGTSRTYESALAFMHGLIQNTSHLVKNRAIDLNAHGTNMCVSKPSGTKCDCEIKSALKDNLSKRHTDVTHNDTLYKNIKTEVGAILEIPRLKVPWIGQIHDVIKAYDCHGLPLPCAGNKTRCFTKQLLNTMEAYLKQYSQNLAVTDEHMIYSLLDIYPLLQDISSNFEHLTLTKSGHKFALYSGHDLTLTPLLAAIGVRDTRQPPYASRVVFELYRNVETKTTSLRVLYNGRDVTTDLRFCQSSILSNGLCPIGNLVEFVKGLKITYNELCKR